MKNKNIDPSKIALAKNISKALSENKVPPQSKDLPSDKLNQLMNILSDEETMKKIIDSEDAKALIKKFGKE